ncbi:MAG: hypothetical protein MJZ68_05050 [archaeon]|nr:hypothetical protein [archaeon]
MDNYYKGRNAVCNKCGHRWNIRTSTDVPNNCPKCRTTKWNETYYDHKCLVCGHSWRSYVSKPLRCSLCFSSRWNKGNVPKIVHSIRRVKPIAEDEVIRKICLLHDQGMDSYNIGKELGIPLSIVMSVIVEKYSTLPTDE